MSQINFLPESFVQDMERRARRTRHIALIVCVLLCMAGWWLGSFQQVRSQSKLADALDQQIQTAEEQKLEMAKLQSRRELLVHQLKVQRELAQTLEHTAVLATIADMMPSSMGMTALAMTTTGMDAKPARSTTRNRKGKAGNNRTSEPPSILLELQGIAENDVQVADFVGALADHVMFEDVKMIYARQAEYGSVIAREFRMELRVPLDREYRLLEPEQEEVAHAH